MDICSCRPALCILVTLILAALFNRVGGARIRNHANVHYINNCSLVKGATNRNSAEYPQCKCPRKGFFQKQSVYCGKSKIAGRKFDAEKARQYCGANAYCASKPFDPALPLAQDSTNAKEKSGKDREADLARRDEERRKHVADANRFVDDCVQSTKKNIIVGICNVERANSLISDYDKGDTTLTPSKAFLLGKFLSQNGGAKHRLTKVVDRMKDKELQDARDAAVSNFQRRQAGAGRVPNAGEIKLEDVKSVRDMAIFFHAALANGKWICFRLADDLSTASYQVFGDSARDLQKEFETWKASFSMYTSDRGPISISNVASVEKKMRRERMAEFSKTAQAKFDKAKRELEGIRQSQSLCVHRFQASLTHSKDATRPKAELFDLPTTWAGSTVEKKMVIGHKAVAIKQWLLKHRVLISDFLRDARPGDFGISYEDAVKKSRGWFR